MNMNHEENVYKTLSEINLSDVMEISLLQKFLDNFAVSMNLASVAVDRREILLQIQAPIPESAQITPIQPKPETTGVLHPIKEAVRKQPEQEDPTSLNVIQG